MNTAVLKLFISIQIELLFISVVGDFVVHAITQDRAGQSLGVLKRLALPHDEHGIRQDALFVSHIEVFVGVVRDQLPDTGSKIFFVHN